MQLLSNRDCLVSDGYYYSAAKLNIDLLILLYLITNYQITKFISSVGSNKLQIIAIISKFISRLRFWHQREGKEGTAKSADENLMFYKLKHKKFSVVKSMYIQFQQ